MYGYTAPEFYGIDDLLDLSNDHIFSSSDTTTTHNHIANNSVDHAYTTNTTATSSSSAMHFHSASDFTNEICVPNDEVAELEWLSNFVDDSYTDFPVTNFTGALNSQSQPPFHSRSRSKRSRAPSITNTWTTSFPQSHIPMQTTTYNYNHNSPISSSSSSDARRCTHCASEKTPQWRTGPLGPKTLCNACGVRYKSGRLVPEYRPAASPTFVLTQHSNSHRKVMELRRQKEEQDGGGHGRHHRRNYEVC